MSDPPVTQPEHGAQPSTLDQVKVDGRDGSELVTEGYIRVTDVFYNWAMFLDPWQAKIVKALINPNSLVHPDHPLREKGQEHFRLFNCLKPEGHEYLCFSLKQVEYLQFYIHANRLAEPTWTNYQAQLASGNDEDQPKTGETIPEPPYVEAENPWVPIPGRIFRAEEFADVEFIEIVEQRNIKKLLNQQKKHNVQMDREMLKNGKKDKLTSEELSKVEAYEENTAPGPGLRRGPVKVQERRRPEQEREEGTGWGGFPTKTAGEEDEVVTMEKADPIQWHEDGKEADQMPVDETDGSALVHGQTITNGDSAHEAVPSDIPSPQPPVQDAKAANGTAASINALSKPVHGTDGVTVEDEAEDDPDPQPDLLAEQLNKLVNLRAQIDSDAPAEAKEQVEDDTPKLEDPIERYFYDAQQAFVLASAGGLATALAQKLKEDKAAGKAEEEEDEGEVPAIPAEIGRSFFFALELTTWEEDENVVLEVGWAATWWQEKIEEKAEGSEKKPDEDEGRYERMTEYGHIIVQDHLLDKRNGRTKPDHRSSYAFGGSTPLQSKDVHRTLSQKLKDLSKRAGGGPIYLLLHSADTDESNFKKLGWKTGGWEKQIRPVDWEYPSYASPEGVGKVFLIDTAKLFGAIEDDRTILPRTGKTRKQLETVAGIMFGSVPEQAPKACANAGNHAAYCLQIFLGIVDGLPLEVLRADYQQSQIPMAVDPAMDDEAGDPTPGTPPAADTAPLVTEPATLPPPDADFARAMAIKADRKPELEAKLFEATKASEPPVARPGAANEKGAEDVKAEEEEEEDDEGIMGVYWEDRNGNVVELSA